MNVNPESTPRPLARSGFDKRGTPDLRLGRELPVSVARDWGLCISTSRGMTSAGIEEPAQFSEPGVFLVRPDDSLYCGAVLTMPFARSRFDELPLALDFVIGKGYPARGEHAAAAWAGTDGGQDPCGMTPWPSTPAAQCSTGTDRWSTNRPGCPSTSTRHMQRGCTPPDPHPNMAYDHIVDGFAALCEDVLANQ